MALPSGPYYRAYGRRPPAFKYLPLREIFYISQTSRTCVQLVTTWFRPHVHILLIARTSIPSQSYQPRTLLVVSCPSRLCPGPVLQLRYLRQSTLARMRPHLPLLFLFLVNVTPSEAEAGLLARSTESVAGPANHLHRRAGKHSAGLVEDLRRAFWGMYAQKFVATSTAGGSQRAYCVKNANGGNPFGGSARGSNGTSSGTSLLVQSSTSGRTGESSATSTTTENSPTATSAKPTSTPLNSSWKLVKSYVRVHYLDAHIPCSLLL